MSFSVPNDDYGGKKVCIEWRFDHVILLVEDLEQGSNHFQHLGFSCAGEPREQSWSGPSSMVSLKEQVLRKGSFALRLQQPVRGAGLPIEFMKKHGEGIYCVGFAVDDVSAASNEMVRKGFPVLHSVEKGDGALLATYHDTREVVDIVVALGEYDGTPRVGATVDTAWTLEHLGVIVSDIHRAREFYESLGFAVVVPPVTLFSPDLSKRILTECLLIKNGFVFELMEPIDEGSLWGEFLRHKNGGINHWSFAVNNLDIEHDTMVAKGFCPTSIARGTCDSLSEVYYDTSLVGNIQTCLYNGSSRLTFENTMRFLIDIGIPVQKG
ncbi:MAG: hypothetical protein GX604_05720 [Actinobacteria bacterium]|nr:hypothetical protein [Actinomycetota bacterium]